MTHTTIVVCCDQMASLLLVEESRIHYSDEGNPYLCMADGDCFPLYFCPFCGKRIEMMKSDDCEKSSKLKPCPFCGSKYVSEWGEVPDGCDKWQNYIECDSCHMHTDYYDDIETAKSVWNKRVKEK